jgi:hypothetical protein
VAEVKRLCSDCEKRPICAEQRGNGGSLCELCLEWASWENEHSDNCHDEIAAGEEMHISEDQLTYIRESSMANCPICLEHTHPRDIEVRKGHTNTQAKTYTSHADCNHPRTPKAREICRRARRAANIPAQPKGRKNVLMSEAEVETARAKGHKV